MASAEVKGWKEVVSVVSSGKSACWSSLMLLSWNPSDLASYLRIFHEVLLQTKLHYHIAWRDKHCFSIEFVATLFNDKVDFNCISEPVLYSFCFWTRSHRPITLSSPLMTLHWWSVSSKATSPFLTALSSFSSLSYDCDSQIVDSTSPYSSSRRYKCSSRSTCYTLQFLKKE